MKISESGFFPRLKIFRKWIFLISGYCQKMDIFATGYFLDNDFGEYIQLFQVPFFQNNHFSDIPTFEKNDQFFKISTFWEFPFQTYFSWKPYTLILREHSLRYRHYQRHICSHSRPSIRHIVRYKAYQGLNRRNFH